MKQGRKSEDEAPEECDAKTRVPAGEQRLLLQDNAARVFNIDVAKLGAPERVAYEV